MSVRVCRYLDLIRCRANHYNEVLPLKRTRIGNLASLLPASLQARVPVSPSVTHEADSVARLEFVIGRSLIFGFRPWI